MPDQAIHDMQQAMTATDADRWDVKLAVDLEAAILFTEINYDRLSAAAQEQALAKGYARGDPVKIGVAMKRGQAPAFTLYASDSIPNLDLIRTSRAPRIAPEAAERMRALRKAMPSLTQGQMDWAKAEFEGYQNPLPIWVTGADDIRGEDGVFGRESIATRRGGVDLLDDRLIDDFAGDGASEWLRATLDDGSAALAHSYHFDVYYVRGRAAPERLLRSFSERWQAEAEPAAADAVITAEPIEPAPEPAASNDSAAADALPCWFCGGASAPDAASKVLLYDPASVQHSVESVGVSDQYTAKYQQLSVPVPRCEKCESAHFRELGWTMLGTAGGFLGGGVAAFGLHRAAVAELGGWLAVAGWTGMALLLIALMVVGYRLGAAKGNVSRGPDIHPEDHNLEFPVVKQLQVEGYQTGKPQAKAPD